MAQKTTTAATPARQLDSFIERFSPETASLAKAVLKTMRERLPGAVEMVYAKSNSDVINSIQGFRHDGLHGGPVEVRRGGQPDEPPLDPKGKRRILIKQRFKKP